MATGFSRNDNGVSTENNFRSIAQSLAFKRDRRALERYRESRSKNPQNETLISPRPFIPQSKQLEYSKIPKTLRNSEDLKIFKGPYDKGLAARKKREKPLPLREGTEYIVLHNTGNNGFEGNRRIIAEKRLAHFFVDKQGNVYQMVPNLGTRTNHVGKRTLWENCKGFDLRDRSIGIEFLGDPVKSKPTNAQMIAARKLVRCLMKMYGIPSENVLSHGMVSCDNINAKRPTRGAYRDIDGAYFVSSEGRRILRIGPGPRVDPNGARPGPATQKIVYDSMRPRLTKTEIVTLKGDETLWRFSKRTGIPLEVIYQLNKGIDPTKLGPNERIRVPMS